MGLFGGPPNVEKLKAKGNIVGLINALGYTKDERVRRDAARALGELRDPQAIDPLIARLTDPDARVRLVAVEALNQFRDPRVVPALIERLGDDNGPVRKLAIAVVVVLREPRAVEPLIQLLRSPNADVRRDAIAALAELGDPRAVDPLIAQLDGRDVAEQREITKALVRLDGKRAVEPLIAKMREGRWDVRKEAAETLDALGWQPADDQQRAFRAIALGEWDEVKQLGASAVEPLIVRVGDPLWDDSWGQDSEVGASAMDGVLFGEGAAAFSGRAIALLVELEDGRAVEPLLARIARGDDEVKRAERTVAARYKKIRRDNSAAIASYLLYGGDLASDMRKAQAEADAELQQFSTTVLVDFVDALRKVRRLAVEAVGSLGDANVMQPLLQFARDPFLAESALRALKTLLARDVAFSEQDLRAAADLSGIVRAKYTGADVLGYCKYTNEPMDAREVNNLARKRLAGETPQQGADPPGGVSVARLYNRGIAYAQQGDFPLAIRLFGAIVDSREVPTDLRAQAAYARSLCQIKAGLPIDMPTDIGDPTVASDVFVARNLAFYLIGKGYPITYTRSPNNLFELGFTRENQIYRIRIQTNPHRPTTTLERQAGDTFVDICDAGENPHPLPTDEELIAVLGGCPTDGNLNDVPLSPFPEADPPMSSQN